MSGWSNFFKSIAPIAASVIGGPVAGALVGGGLGLLSSRAQARGQQQVGQQAGQTALGGFNYLQGSPIGTQYLPAGGQAINQQAALLGVGGDPTQANAAYQNYLNSTGYQGQLAAGSQAITGNNAARGLLGSGATAKALTQYGQQLGAQSFNNYLGQLNTVAGMGLQAGGMLGQSANSGYGQAAQYQYGAGMDANQTRASGWDQLIGGLGGAYEAWNAGRGGGGVGGRPILQPIVNKPKYAGPYA